MDREKELQWFFVQYVKNSNERTYKQLLTILEADLLKFNLKQYLDSQTKEEVK